MSTGTVSTPGSSQPSSTNGTSTTSTTKTTTSTSSTTTKDGTDWSSGKGLIPGRDVLGPLLLMLTTPCFSIVFFHVCTALDGNFVRFGALAHRRGWIATVREIWPTPWHPRVWTMLLSFMAFELILMKLVPGKQFVATLTPAGNRPIYKANGVACYIITLVTLLLLAHFQIFDPADIYNYFGQILSTLNVFAYAFCLLLYVKGHVAPSSSDSGTTGSIVQDFYWGMELYPRIAGWDIKMFTNCRFGLMFWAVANVAHCYKNMQLNDGQLNYGLAASVAIQLVYLTKFYYWEMGYMCSMDIQHDRAGYYICWGCLVWVPAVYTSQAFYLTTNAPDLSWTTALAIFVAGSICVWINYDSDNQRYVFRQTWGQCTIWGRKPNMIVAYYEYKPKTTAATKEAQQQQEKDETKVQMKESILLVDGWWKFSRHFHYVPEILASFFWSVSALNTGFVAPYFYVIYLTILLTDRAYRDDDRCSKKYGQYWQEYCQQVPYKIIPGVV